jgi:predicted nucleic acid-binding protein
VIAVSDTSVISYLVIIEEMDLLPRLFGRVLIPQAVLEELNDPRSPLSLRAWMHSPPDWLEICEAPQPSPADLRLDLLDAGEREAIILALQRKADWILLDERAARQEAQQRGLSVMGLIGILNEAATRGWINVAASVERLRQTRFRATPQLFKELLDRHSPESD